MGALAWLRAGVSFSGRASLLDLLSNLETEKMEPITPLQKQESGATTGVALQNPDLEAILLALYLTELFQKD